MTQRCIACGKPMRRSEDHATADPTKEFCHHCARPDGAMMSYDEMIEGLVAFLTGFEGLAPHRARSMAEAILAEKPAWKGW